MPSEWGQNGVEMGSLWGRFWSFSVGFFHQAEAKKLTQPSFRESLTTLNPPDASAQNFFVSSPTGLGNVHSDRKTSIGFAASARALAASPATTASNTVAPTATALSDTRQSHGNSIHWSITPHASSD